MEEDIKILEEKLKQWEPYRNVKFTTEIEKEIARENRAIENLINRNKELESYYQCERNLLDNYIPKSKIEEIIKQVNESNGFSPVNKILIEQVLNSILKIGG